MAGDQNGAAGSRQNPFADFSKDRVAKSRHNKDYGEADGAKSSHVPILVPPAAQGQRDERGRQDEPQNGRMERIAAEDAGAESRQASRFRLKRGFPIPRI
jgi:hypothetical protein